MPGIFLTEVYDKIYVKINYKINYKINLKKVLTDKKRYAKLIRAKSKK